MNTDTMIQHAFTHCTLVILERPGRAIIGTIARDLDGLVVIKVIRGAGVRVGERVTVAASLTTRVTAPVVQEARSELADYLWDQDADDLSVWSVIKRTRGHYGSWAQAASCLV